MRRLPHISHLLLGLAGAGGVCISSCALPAQAKGGRPPAVRPLSAADGASLRRALEDDNAGRLYAARPVLLDLARRYPANGEVQSAAGTVLAESGDLDSALPYLERAHRLAPADAPTATNLGLALLKSSHPAEAARVLEEASRRAPQMATIRMALAQALQAEGQHGAAATNYQLAAGLMRPEDGINAADLRHDWAVALLDAGRPPEAAAVIQTSPGLENSAPLQELLGEVEEKSGRYESAVLHLKRAAELDASEPNVYAYAAELLRHWTFPAAIEILRFGASRFPGSERTRLALGIGYFGQNNFAEAAQVFAGMLNAQPENGTAADLLGRSCAAQAGTSEPACAGLVAFAKAHPANTKASLYAAVTLLHQPPDQTNTTDAEALLRSALQRDTQLAEGWYQLATVQQARDDWNGSAESLKRAVASRPAYPEAHYRLSRAYAHLGQREAAQQEIALQQRYAANVKEADANRLKEVMTFLIINR